jgi:hypothetical protein
LQIKELSSCHCLCHLLSIPYSTSQESIRQTCCSVTQCYNAATATAPVQQLQTQGPPKDLKHPSAAATAHSRHTTTSNSDDRHCLFGLPAAAPAATHQPATARASAHSHAGSCSAEAAIPVLHTPAAAQLLLLLLLCLPAAAAVAAAAYASAVSAPGISAGRSTLAGTCSSTNTAQQHHS